MLKHGDENDSNCPKKKKQEDNEKTGNMGGGKRTERVNGNGSGRYGVFSPNRHRDGESPRHRHVP